MRMKTKLLVALTPLLVASAVVVAQNNASSSKTIASESEFKDPSVEYRPRTWYHINSGNMSKEGFTKDLNAIQRAGLGGILAFNVSMGLPDGDVEYNSAEHREILTHAARECERLGLSFGVHNCDGWTSSGGPWVEPEHSMKIVVNSEALVNVSSKGKSKGSVDVTLPLPPTRDGFYKDIAVIAYPTLDYEKVDAVSKPVVTTSNPDADGSLIVDGDIESRALIVTSNKEKGWFQLDYGKPFTARSISAFVASRICKMALYSSDDGVNFTLVNNPKDERIGKFENYFYENIPVTTARYYRMEVEPTMNVIEVSLSSGERVNNMLGYTSYKRAQRRMDGDADPSMVINPDDIVVLSDKMDSEGRVVATLPAGEWTIARYGFTTSGATNEPASDAGTGLEVDKLSSEALKIHFDAFVGKLIEATKLDAPNAMQYAEVDSYEVGPQNWTDGLEEIFAERYGYDIIPFLPVFDGKYVSTNSDIDEIFWDMKRLVSDLMVENYFDYFTELCHEAGIVSYVEPYGFVGPFNSLDAGRNVDIPMGEFWFNKENNHKPAPVSSAHIYGKNVISAEAFTSTSLGWGVYPAALKSKGDYEWTNGINEYMFHRFAHQSNTHVRPGMTMYNVGSHIDGTQTWWDDAGAAWFKYLARGSYMLRQGLPVLDLLLFVGDTSPNHIVTPASFNPSIPAAYKADCVNADVIINRLSVQDGKLTLPDGTQYNALVLPKSDKITLETLRGIERLAKDGALIIGAKPNRLGGYIQSEQMKSEFESLLSSIWGSSRSYESYDWDAIFEANGVERDLIVEGYPEFKYYHRRSDTEDIYFIYNPSESEGNTFECSFRVSSKVPELWNAVTGEICDVDPSDYSFVDGRTSVSIELEGNESTFVVFRKAADGASKVSAKAKVKTLPSPIAVDSEWSIDFCDKVFYTGDAVVTDKLFDWQSHAVDDIKYYSGTAIYTTSFDMPKSALKSGADFVLDLGDVSIAARVILNGVDLGVSWVAPFKVDVTSALRSGKNELQIEVTNTWTNRLVGDAKLPDQTNYKVTGRVDGTRMPEWFRNNEPMPEGPRRTWSSFTFHNAKSKTEPAGLMGPVKIVAE